MNMSLLPDSDYLIFSSNHRINFGSNVTVIGEPIKHNGRWVINALTSLDTIEELFLESKEIIDENFLVLSSIPSEMKEFSNIAISSQSLDQKSQSIEENIFEILYSLQS